MMNDQTMDLLITDIRETANCIARKGLCPLGYLTYELYKKYGNYSSFVYVVVDEDNEPDNKNGFINFYAVLNAAGINNLFGAFADLYAEDIISVKNFQQEKAITEELYRLSGKYEVEHIISCFSSWKAALQYAKERELKRFQSEPRNQKKRRSSIGAKKRYLVFMRDNFTCVSCGASPHKNPNVELQVDHIKPIAKGGTNDIDNLQTLCSVCNSGKSDIYEI